MVGSTLRCYTCHRDTQRAPISLGARSRAPTGPSFGSSFSRHRSPRSTAPGQPESHLPRDEIAVQTLHHLKKTPCIRRSPPAYVGFTVCRRNYTAGTAGPPDPRTAITRSGHNVAGACSLAACTGMLRKKRAHVTNNTNRHTTAACAISMLRMPPQQLL